MSDELEVCRAANERLLRELAAARAEITRLQKQRVDLIDAMEFYQRPGERVAVREVVAIARDRTWYQDGHGNWDKTVLLFEASGKIDITRGTTVTIRPVVAKVEQEGTS